MAVFLLCLTLAQVPPSEVVLDYRKPIRFSTYTPRVMSEDYLVIRDDESILLFRFDGSFAGSYGRKGQGPGEFLTIGEIALVDETTLAILDHGTKRITLFDLEKRQFGRHIRFSGLTIVPDRLNNTLYRLDYEVLPYGTKPSSPHYRRVAKQPILKALSMEEGAHSSAPAFHLPSAMQIDWSFNDPRHWVIAKGQKKWVMEQLKKTVWVYDESGRKTATLNAPLKGFLPPEGSFPSLNSQSRDMYRAWWFGYSRLLDFNANDRKVLCAYTVPVDPPDYYQSRVTVADWTFDQPTHTTIQGHYSESENGGYYFGSNRQRFAFFILADTDFLPQYKVVFHAW